MAVQAAKKKQSDFWGARNAESGISEMGLGERTTRQTGVSGHVVTGWIRRGVQSWRREEGGFVDHGILGMSLSAAPTIKGARESDSKPL